MELATFTEKLLNGVRQVYRFRILQQYPDDKQRNVDGGRDDNNEKTDMDTFIQAQRTAYRVVKAEIAALTTTAIYDDFIARDKTTNSDANMISYVAAAMTTLTTDEQKLSVAIALQGIL